MSDRTGDAARCETPLNMVASAERPNGGINGVIAQPAQTGTINVVCPAGFQEAGVFISTARET